MADVGARVVDLYSMATQYRTAPGQSWKWRALLVRYLHDRDGDRCAVCAKKINLDLRSGPKGDDLGASVDHIIPRSQGGTDDPANLRLLHWGCNRKRKANGGNEQLALVG